METFDAKAARLKAAWLAAADVAFLLRTPYSPTWQGHEAWKLANAKQYTFYRAYAAHVTQEKAA